MKKFIIILISALFVFNVNLYSAGKDDNFIKLCQTYKAKDSSFEYHDLMMVLRIAKARMSKEDKAKLKDVTGYWFVYYDNCPENVRKDFLSDLSNILKTKESLSQETDEMKSKIYFSKSSDSDKVQDVIIVAEITKPVKGNLKNMIMYIQGELPVDKALDLSHN